jgi:hypothetical protein
MLTNWREARRARAERARDRADYVRLMALGERFIRDIGLTIDEVAARLRR